jgi:hypothetical protein
VFWTVTATGQYRMERRTQDFGKMDGWPPGRFYKYSNRNYCSLCCAVLCCSTYRRFFTITVHYCTHSGTRCEKCCVGVAELAQRGHAYCTVHVRYPYTVCLISLLRVKQPSFPPPPPPFFRPFEKDRSGEYSNLRNTELRCVAPARQRVSSQA